MRIEQRALRCTGLASGGRRYSCAEKILAAERSLEVNDMCMPIKQILNLIPGTR